VTADRRYGVEDRRIVNAITLMEQNIERPVPMKTVASLSAFRRASSNGCG
jgi:transcriptional regulator GlxA family with amidase domain